MSLCKPYIYHKRYFAKIKKEKGQSTLSQLKADKTTQQYSEILSWWNKIKKSRLDITLLAKELQVDFIDKRTKYKQLNIERINTMNSNMLISMQRKQEAINALPPRLAFICKVSKQPKWKNDLSDNVQNTYNNLHHLYNINDMNNINNINNLNKLRYKEQHQIDALENERVNSQKSYKFSNSPLEYFPPLYDPNDIRTQPSYVKSYFDYKWKPGTDIPISIKKNVSSTSIMKQDDNNNNNIYGKDYSQLQLSKIIHIESVAGSSGAIGGTEDLKKKLEAEEEANLTAQQKLERERGKKTAEARAKNSLRLEKIRQTKDKIKQSVKDWEKQIKGRDNNDNDNNDNDNDNEQQNITLKRIEELELLNKDLPKIETLLVDKELNKQFFEKTLHLILNENDNDKKEQCMLLMRKYYTLQKHVGYMTTNYD